MFYTEQNSSLFTSQRRHRVDSRRAVGGQPAGDDQGRQDTGCYGNERHRIERTDAGDLMAQDPGPGKRQRDTEGRRDQAEA